MKKEKGITLISLTVYIIAMTLAVSIMTVISSYFFKNVDNTLKNVNPLTEYTKFNSFFTEEINRSNIKVLECENNYIVFNDGSQYTFIQENEAIYRNKVKICEEVQMCTFNYVIKNSKKVVIVDIKMKEGKKQTVEYTLQN